jgi:hypothetical protein
MGNQAKYAWSDGKNIMKAETEKYSNLKSIIF